MIMRCSTCADSDRWLRIIEKERPDMVTLLLDISMSSCYELAGVLSFFLFSSLSRVDRVTRFTIPGLSS